MRPLVFEKSLTVRTGLDLRAAIEERAAKEGASASAWVRDALKAAVAEGRAARTPAARDRVAA
ncbi:hypothetical protein [Methylobacterium nonmethylotrophicum]|uniref:Ribbon-helix-helix protein CopG domain-containing protein n=1 Tax=Methylobacterium nonmethylotrophicum TaxID=1141884 RepID=A0A4Z0NDQ2_9HYPH|nr:hypothetical protein [Methylobacterium nonmethylotrophicum]TGD93728.1 hypothetical protein EU555_33110 [Methylobacterium nonmethylotrophicum]